MKQFVPRRRPTEGPEIVVLVDQDYDGTIDAHHIVSAAQFHAPGGWGDLEHYPTWWH